jgi:hypothetical protein
MCTSFFHESLPASDYAVCASGILAKGTKHSQFFRSRSNYDKFLGYCLRISKSPQIKVARLAQEALLAWFDTLEGEGAAKTWFRDNWLGARGFWTAADAGYAGSWNNCAFEATWRWLKQNCCVAGRNGPFHIVLAITLDYFKLRTKEHERRLTELGTPNTIPSLPEFTNEIWGRAYAVDRNAMDLIYLMHTDAGGDDRIHTGRDDRIQEVLDMCNSRKIHHLSALISFNEEMNAPVIPYPAQGVSRILMPTPSLLRFLYDEEMTDENDRRKGQR